MNNTIVDPDGEVVSIEDLKLTLAGSLDYEPPEIRSEFMQDFAVAVARTGTYDQRHMPIWKKFVILWRVFSELFLNRCYLKEDDPFLMVAARWYRRQQIIPISRKDRWKILFKRIRDMFIHVSTAEPIDTYGMPGFEPRLNPNLKT